MKLTMKKLIAMVMITLVSGCDSASDADANLRSLYNICDHDSYRVTRVNEGNTVILTVTCERKKLAK